MRALILFLFVAGVSCDGIPAGSLHDEFEKYEIAARAGPVLAYVGSVDGRDRIALSVVVGSVPLALALEH